MIKHKGGHLYTNINITIQQHIPAHLNIYIRLYIIGKKIKRPSFAYYKFISAGFSIRAINHFK